MIYCPSCLKEGKETILLAGAYLKNGSTAEQVCGICKNKIHIDVDIDGVINTNVIRPKKTISQSA